MKKKPTVLFLILQIYSLFFFIQQSTNNSVMFATSQEFPTTILNFDLCDRTSVELDPTWSDQLEYPTNTCFFTLPSSRVDLNKKTACFD